MKNRFFFRGGKRIPSRTRRGVVRRDYEHVAWEGEHSCNYRAENRAKLNPEVTKDRSGKAFGLQLVRIAKAYPKAKVIHVIVDNLNTHYPTALHLVLPKAAADRMARRFKFHVLQSMPVGSTLQKSY